MYDEEEYDEEGGGDSGKSSSTEEQVNKLIEAAAQEETDENIRNLFEKLQNRELYLKTADADGVSIPIYTIKENLTAFILFTSSTDDRLSSQYGGTVWESALQMLLGMENVDALAIQSLDSGAYVCVTKEKARVLLLGQQRRTMLVNY